MNRDVDVLLNISGLTKRYAVTVLDNCDLEVRAGEIHALLGANGAGKSTMCKIIAGLLAATAGSMTLAGKAYSPANKQAAEAIGVQIVQQELNLIPTLSVAENLLLTRLPARAGVIRQKELHARARRALDRFGLHDQSSETPVGALGVGRQQMVEIAAALDQDCRLLILDEPTAALSAGETAALFQWLQRLRRQGVGIIYISHRLEEVGTLADRVTILRDGKHVCTCLTSELTTEKMVDLMSGEAANATAYSKHQSKASEPAAMRIEGISRGLVRDVSFTVHRGERLGIAGLVGSGRTELLRAIFGADVAEAGRVYLGNKPTPRRFRHPSQAVAAGLAMVTEDRKQNGLLLTQSIRFNLTLGALWQSFSSGGVVRRQSEEQAASAMCQSLETRCNSVEQPVSVLSGGNQQKVAVAKWLVRDADVFLFDEPTRGIDVAARRRIYRLIESLADAGKGIVIVSGDLDELLETCDRIAVMSAGRLVEIFDRSDWSHSRIMQAAFSGYARQPTPEARNGWQGKFRTEMNRQKLAQTFVEYVGLLAVLVLMVGVFSLRSENFFQRSTLVSIANQIPDLTFVAVGMTLVLITGGIDLSVGSVLALSSAVLGVLMVDYGWPLWGASAVCLLTAAACGLFNGMVSIGFGIPSFIVTLGMLEIARGATKVVTDSQTKYIGSAVESIGEPLPGFLLSPAFLLAVLAVIVGQFLLTRTVFGRYYIAIGTNVEAVRMSGIRSAPYAISVFVISGLMCGLAGIAQTSRLSSADPNAAIGMELSAIAACVIGGTSLMGGRGSVISSFIGVLIIAVLQTGLAQLGVSDANKQIITGSVIVIAVLLDALRIRWGKKNE